MTRCRSCGAAQSDVKFDCELANCCRCKKRPFTESGQWIFIDKPESGEKDLDSIVVYVVMHPSVVFEMPGPWNFLAKLDSSFKTSDLVLFAGDMFHVRDKQVRPQLNSFLWMASYFGALLLDTLLYPREAARQMAIDLLRKIGKAHSKRRVIDQERVVAYELAIKKAINAGPPYPSIKRLALQSYMFF